MTTCGSAVRVLKFGDWTEFTRDAFVELFEDGIFRHGRYLFRGAADADFDLRSLRPSLRDGADASSGCSCGIG